MRLYYIMDTLKKQTLTKKINMFLGHFYQFQFKSKWFTVNHFHSRFLRKSLRKSRGVILYPTSHGHLLLLLLLFTFDSFQFAFTKMYPQISANCLFLGNMQISFDRLKQHINYYYYTCQVLISIVSMITHRLLSISIYFL